MTPTSYPCPLPAGGQADEFALAFDAGRTTRLLVIPALFDEGAKLRRFTVELMRRLDGSGCDCFLPDLPGCNESGQDLALIEPEDWATAMHAAARHFSANRVLAIRGGSLLVPPGLAGWIYAPVKGASLLKTMLRARIIAARESGIEESIDDLMASGTQLGIELGGFTLSGEMLRQLQAMTPVDRAGLARIEHELVGGAPLWLRAEPDYDPDQADALAAVIAMELRA